MHDLILMAESEESLRDKIVKWKSWLEAIGLKMNTGKMKKRSGRRKDCARAGCSRFGHRPPARPLSQTHRQDRLQYTAPQLASAQYNEGDVQL